MKIVASLLVGISLFTLSAQAESVSATASLGQYDVELSYRILPRFKTAKPTLHTEDIHDGFDLKCVSNLELEAGFVQVNLFKAGTRELVSTQNVSLKVGNTQYEAI